MSPKFLRLFHLIVLCLVLASLSACDAVRMVIATPTPVPTETPLPSPTPLPTDTPPPPPTFTPLPTETPTLPPPPTVPPPPSPTPPVTDPILVYYINKNDKGPWGCNEALWWVKTNQNRTTSLVNDVTFALRTILYYHNPDFGDLYNPGYASNLAVSSVEVRDDGTVVVNLTGTYTKTDDRCDGPRFRDQLKQTVKQFANVQNVIIYINGTPIADVIARK